MFLGAMIMGPLGGYSMKKIDAIWTARSDPASRCSSTTSPPASGEVLAILGFVGAGPFVEQFSKGASSVVDTLVDNGLLPLTSIFIEPAKILFLNNAINQGILTPLGTSEAAQEGKSILFLLEANPGPGLGLLLAFTFFGTGWPRPRPPARSSSSSSAASTRSTSPTC